MINANRANFAYQEAIRSRGQVLEKADPVHFRPTGGGIKNDNTLRIGDTFSDLVKQNVGSTIDDLRNAERISLEGVKGNADINEVVNAVNSAESSLKTMIALRDKIITSYQEILKMPV